MKYSERIENFLDFLREAQQEYNMALASEKYTNDASQDLLHILELGNLSYHERARVSEALQQVRRERRIAKDRWQKLQPVVDWILQSNKTINILEQLLGTVRKAEKSTENRYYNPKTDIIERTMKRK